MYAGDDSDRVEVVPVSGDLGEHSALNLETFAGYSSLPVQASLIADEDRPREFYVYVRCVDGWSWKFQTRTYRRWIPGRKTVSYLLSSRERLQIDLTRQSLSSKGPSFRQA
jgi:hypothetical protein